MQIIGTAIDMVKDTSEYIVSFFLVLIFVLTVILHLKKNVIRSVHELIALIAATFVAKVYSWPLGSIIMRQTDMFITYNDRRANAVLFSIVVIFVATFVIVNFLLFFIEKLFKMTEVKLENKILEIVLGAFLGIFYVGIAVFIIKLIEITGFTPIEEITSKSALMGLYVKFFSSYFPYASVLLGA